MVLGLVDLPERLRAIITAITIRGIPAKEIVGEELEGKIPLTRTRTIAYATTDQRSNFAVFI
jgi:hypothetical protein